MIFRIDRAIYGLLFTAFGVVIVVWLWSEGEWSVWPLLGAGGALSAGLALLCLAFLPSRPGRS